MLAERLHTTPRAHQLEDLERSWALESFALFNQMGTGKSKEAIDTAFLLYEAGRVDAAFVVAPKGSYRNWTEVEVPRHFAPSVEADVVAWPKVPAGAAPFVWFVMNVEALSTRRGAEAAERFLQSRRAIAILDESSAIKNPKAKRTQALLSMRHLAPYRRLLDGLPVSRSPLDLYTQCLFLDWRHLGFQSYYAFRNRYAVLGEKEVPVIDPQTRRPVLIEKSVEVQDPLFGDSWTEPRWVPKTRTVRTEIGFQRLDELNAKLERFSVRRRKSECLDLPEKVYERRDVDLTPPQRTAYEAMRKKARAELSQGKATTSAILTQILRLRQIACGFLPLDDGTLQPLPHDRETALLEALDQVDGKAIVWASFQESIRSIERAIAREYGAASVVTYYGPTPDAERPRIVEQFQTEATPRFFVGHPKTGGEGLTLVAASTVLYFSNDHDLRKRLQSEDRTHRIGQTESVTYLDFVAPGTVEERILESFRGKRRMASEILGDEWEEWI